MDRGLTVTAIFVPPILRVAANAGLKVSELMARFGLPADPQFEQRIPASRLIRLWEAIVRIAADPDMPVRAAMMAAHDERSLLSFVGAAKDTVREGLKILVDYYPTVTDAYRWELTEGKNLAILSAEPSVDFERLGWRCQIVFEVVDIVRTIGTETRGKARTLRVQFTHRPPRSLDAYTAALGVTPLFLAPRIEIAWPREALALPSLSAKPALARELEPRLRTLLDLRIAKRAISQRVRHVLPSMLRKNFATSQLVARHLGLGRRTFERRLEAEGKSFRDLVDEVRYQLSREWLRHLSIAQVAERLGYSDVRAFDRAFKRWSGTTPSLYRQHH